MKSFFTTITKLSIRFRGITFALMALISVLGVVSITQLKQELLPSISLPQTVILAQVSGMSSDQLLNVVTKRLEDALAGIPEVVNMESTTTGAFGSVIIARNDYGLNQERIETNIRMALNSVWLPQRQISVADGQNPQEFANTLLADMTPDVLIYLAERDSNFLFQLSPEVWGALPDDTVRSVLAYLASAQTEVESNKGALRNLIDQEIVPQVEALDVVASVSVSGGQALPGEETADVPVIEQEGSTAQSLLLQLSPEVWQVVSAKAGNLGALDENAVETLAATQVDVPESAPSLPESWQREYFSDASDLAEMQSLTRTVAAVFNEFYSSGAIVGSLGQTDDLTPDVITQMLAIDPTLVEYFEAEHLAAMSPEVFEALPDTFVAGLDGFTRDELAAKALAREITQEDANPLPVDLPSAWRISPPQLISFSFDDIPLASFSISSTAAPTEVASDTTDTIEVGEEAETDETEAVEGGQTAERDIPEGPALPPIFALMGLQFGATINTADDLIDLQLPEEAAEQFGQSTLSAANLLNFILLLADPANLPPGTEAPPIPVDPNQIIGSLSPEAVAFLAEHDPTFLRDLQDGVFQIFSDDVLSLPEITPPLASVWDTLANQPQFQDTPLRTAADLIAIGDGKASAVLNTINESVPQDFAGYEVRLFDSLTPATLRYLSLQEEDFYANLDADVLTKLSPEGLAALPQDVIEGLDEETATTVQAIASGEANSAAEALAALYSSDVPAADPNAPALNTDWALIGNFMGVELDTADDFSRFFPNTTDFLNSIFDSAQGAAFGPSLFGNLSPEAFTYMVEKDPVLLTDLRFEALQLLPDNVLSTLPADIQERARSGGTPFQPTAAVTRTNGNASLLITVYKSAGSNTVEAFHTVEDLLHDIQERDPSIQVDVAFEQASFIEESISGVAREGGLGGIFAVVVILAFLSTGVWMRSGRRIVGLLMIVLFLGLLGLIVLSNQGAAGGDLGLAFAETDIVVKVLLILGAITGLVIMIWPGDLPYPAWRSTLVVSISIPLSLLMTFLLMNWLSPAVHELLAPAAESSGGILAFILRLFPASLTINIMTLSGLTVAIGRVVDDSIVVLENISRHIQEGGDKREAVIDGVRDVSVAIFSATVITVVVFLPLGLTGGIISEFFLPFGLSVTYALMASFVVAITVVPVMAYLFIDNSEISEEEHHGLLERLYVPSLRWALSSGVTKGIVLLVAFASLVFGGALFATRPTSFLPSLGEPQITVSVSMPGGTKIVDTNAKVVELENWLRSEVPEAELGAVQTVVGSGGQSLESLIGAGSSVSENVANITIGIESPDQLDAWAGRIRSQAETIFGTDNVTVSAASLSDQGFGGFELVLSGPDEDLAAINQTVIDTLNSIPGITNATSDLSVVGTGEDAPKTYIRIDRESAVSFGAELETDNTLGVTQQAVTSVEELPDLPDTVSVSQGFNSELQSEGFQSLGIAMGIAMLLVIAILILTFRSVVFWFAIILSVVVAPVGAAVLLALTDRVLGISAMIGLLMLIGIVVTNAVVLIDRVQSNRQERGMSVHDALIEAGGRRLRPILMTAIATVFALLPLAIGLSKGAIIASELGTVVIGGLVSSTLLTLIVVPVMYSLLAPLHDAIARMVGRGGN